MKTGIIGGTFDPIHCGHINIARAALHEYALDSMWFMPAGDPYFKEGHGVTAPEKRLHMTRLAAAEYPDELNCTDFEIRQQGHTYSADTFAALKRRYPDEEFYFVLGLDSLESLEKWYKPELLLANTVILCALRTSDSGKRGSAQQDAENAKAEMLAERLKERFAAANPDIRFIHTPLIDISSTMIREKVRRSEDISSLVPKSVAEYIYAEQLYI